MGMEQEVNKQGMDLRPNSNEPYFPATQRLLTPPEPKEGQFQEQWGFVLPEASAGGETPLWRGKNVPEVPLGTEAGP